MSRNLFRSKWFYFALLSLAVVICGIVRDAREAFSFGACGVVLTALVMIGNIVAPSANQTAYFDKRAGRRLTADGRPYYDYDDDVRKYGRSAGLRRFACKYAVTGMQLALAVAYVCMFGYGLYAVFHL